MTYRKSLFLLPLLIIFLFAVDLDAKSARYRLVWQDDPATTMVVGWDQVSGNGGKVYYDVVNHGKFPTKYAFSKNPSNSVQAKGMSNHFVHLSGLRPNTTYYFVVGDSDGAGRVLSFKTAPKSLSRLSIVAGSDSRNHRTARVDANKMVSKLRPHCVMFGGDFTENDSDSEWINWFDDWQNTISKDGMMYPIIPARGNHEFSNKTLIQLFDVKYKGINYALTLGKNLLRIYTLNSMVASGGEQRSWLQRDLASNPDVIWKTAQYHLSTRPHCAKKGNNNDQWGNWSKYFFEYGVNLVVESDAHTVKSTYPLRPSTEEGSEEGFIRDDEKGTVYIGEGCWGAPLRKNDDRKSWTRAGGSFNSFHWIFVDQNKMEIRFVKTDGADAVAEVNPNNIFMMPRGIKIWNPPTGDVIVIEKNNSKDLVSSIEGGESVEAGFKIIDFVISQKGDDIVVDWKTVNEPEGAKYVLHRKLGETDDFKVIKTIEGLPTAEGVYTFIDEKFAANNKATLVRYKLNSITERGVKQTVDSRNSSRPKKNLNKKPKQSSKPKPKTKYPLLQMEGLTASIEFITKQSGNSKVRLFSKGEVVKEWKLNGLKPGKQEGIIDFTGIRKSNYVLVIFGPAGKPLRKYVVQL